jgi:hypothetical protein
MSAGAVQRKSSTGGLRRNTSTGALRRNTAANTTCCCGGCAECTGFGNPTPATCRLTLTGLIDCGCQADAFLAGRLIVFNVNGSPLCLTRDTSGGADTCVWSLIDTTDTYLHYYVDLSGCPCPSAFVDNPSVSYRGVIARLELVGGLAFLTVTTTGGGSGLRSIFDGAESIIDCTSDIVIANGLGGCVSPCTFGVTNGLATGGSATIAWGGCP